MPGTPTPPDPAPATDGVSRLFDQWAESGRSEHLEREHSKTVLKFLDGIRFRDSFSFLDVGCGNGWVVRRVAQMDSCRRAVGIDKSPGMIKKAASRRQSGKESYRATDVESVRSGRFDYVFSMETIYYAASVEAAVRKIYRLLKPGGCSSAARTFTVTTGPQTGGQAHALSRCTCCRAASGGASLRMPALRQEPCR